MRVLLIEDNPGDAELVRLRLCAPVGQYELAWVSSLAEGLEVHQRGPPAVTLLDLNLPDSDGLETVRALRAANEAAPIVVLTGTDDLDTAVAALRDGADDYVAKSEISRDGILGRALRYGVERRRTLNELRVAVRAREELLQVVSHDLRNHLNTIELGARTLRVTATPEEVGRRMAPILRASATARRLLDDLVDLAAIEKGVLVVSPEPTDAPPILREAHAAFCSTADQKGVRLELDPPDGRVVVLADAVRVTQILGNLLSNALKLTPSGGTVTLAAAVTGMELLVQVKDTGPGIAAGDAQRIFERYDRGSRPSGPGAGLGLAISRALVEAHRGRIWVESEEGRGATFYFTLPLLTGHPPGTTS